jgi:hypothetical protein
MKTEKDKQEIWTDCPQCAYKHMTAAYALLTPIESTPDLAVPWVPLFLARASIALTEAQAGYEGNRALAVGCLAAAEDLQSADREPLKSVLRELRLDLGSGKPIAPVQRSLEHLEYDDLESSLRVVDVHAAGHITEALREAPALLSDFGFPCCFEQRGFYYWSRENIVELIRNAVAWLEETYELRGPTE